MSVPSAASASRARALVVALAVLCVAGGFLAGRKWPSVPESKRGYLEQLAESLDLRPDQVAAVERLLNDEDRDLDALLQRGIDGIRGDVAVRRTRTEQDVLALLDAAQRRRYDELTAEAR
jgi:hypothetical protein